MSRYKPMLAGDAEAPFSSPDWIYEIKWDGIRAISYVDDELSIRSRNGKELKDRFPELEELKEIAKDVVLDGEIIVMREGRVDFQAVAKRNQVTASMEIDRLRRTFPATYVVFDILERDGAPLTDRSLIERRRALEESVKDGKHVVLSAYVEENGEAYLQAALQKGLEGIIAKRRNSRYVQGRSNNWLKIKMVKTCDCAIFGYTKGRGSREETFGALILGLYKDGKATYVGKVGTGFSQSDLEDLIGLFGGLEEDEETLPDADIPSRVTWLRPELVCEVGYHSVTREGRLRMPRFLGMRTDKAPMDCTLDQIIPKDLEEYASKRDFNKTPEPPGGDGKAVGNIFVVQEHHARRLHYDLRLERDGVLKSWAVPKGPPEKPGIRRLAVEVEDHPLEYGEFEGTIPEGQYGAGTVRIWDKGVYEPLVWEEDKIEFLLQGERLSGRYVLVRLKKTGENDWLLLKARG
ncbi:MAG: non-homologous end-joining DNA ligase [Candidatus Bathyarchaeota archaeon]|nr:non-homologous end-joining DNA ligase [Candidatus Bathyarchaeota archaeon]